MVVNEIFQLRISLKYFHWRAHKKSCPGSLCIFHDFYWKINLLQNSLSIQTFTFCGKPLLTNTKEYSHWICLPKTKNRTLMGLMGESNINFILLQSHFHSLSQKEWQIKTSVWVFHLSLNDTVAIKKKKIYGPFLWMGFNCLKARSTSRRQFTFYH